MVKDDPKYIKFLNDVLIEEMEWNDDDAIRSADVPMKASLEIGKSWDTLIPLNNNGAIRLTISKYYLPSGKSISGTGITPDIEVEESSDKFRIGTETDNQLDFAITLLNG